MERWKRECKSLWRDLGARRWLFLLVLGLLLVLLGIPARKTEEKETSPIFFQSEQEVSPTGNGEKEENYEKELEERLKEILSSMDQVGKVKVMVTLKTSKEKVYQVDVEEKEDRLLEEDTSGGRREKEERDISQMTVKSSSGELYLVKEQEPVIEGVLISCEGGDKARVKTEISEAVQALFGVEAHKIKVCKMTSK